MDIIPPPRKELYFLFQVHDSYSRAIVPWSSSMIKGHVMWKATCRLAENHCHLLCQKRSCTHAVQSPQDFAMLRLQLLTQIQPISELGEICWAHYSNRVSSSFCRLTLGWNHARTISSVLSCFVFWQNGQCFCLETKTIEQMCVNLLLCNNIDPSRSKSTHKNKNLSKSKKQKQQVKSRCK